MMPHKYILLICWYIGMILLVSGLYLQDTKFKKKKLCKCIAATGAVLVIAAVSAIGVVTIV